DLTAERNAARRSDRPITDRRTRRRAANRVRSPRVDGAVPVDVPPIQESLGKGVAPQTAGHREIVAHVEVYGMWPIGHILAQLRVDPLVERVSDGPAPGVVGVPLQLSDAAVHLLLERVVI